MKLNIVKVLNEIASEEASVNLLNDPNAWWNNTFNMHDLYEYEMNINDMMNDQLFDLCDWLMSNGQSYENIEFHKKPSYKEWLENMNNNYMVFKIAA